jgi:argininosuccinate synthase
MELVALLERADEIGCRHGVGIVDHIEDRIVGLKVRGIELYKGSARVVTRESPNAVYDQSPASFGESGGLFSQQASPGFIGLWSLQSRMAHRLRMKGES